MSCPQAHRLGAVAVGADDSERPGIERHLRTCPACRVELVELREVSSLLRLVDVEALAAPAEKTTAGNELLARVLATMTAERQTRTRARRRNRFLVAVAAVFVVGVAATGVTIAWNENESGPPAFRPVARSQFGVRATTTLLDQPWGTRIEMGLRGLPDGSSCRLVAVDRDGRTETIASWRVTYENSFQVEAMTSIRTHDLLDLHVIDQTGRRLIDIAVTPKEGPAR